MAQPEELKRRRILRIRCLVNGLNMVPVVLLDGRYQDATPERAFIIRCHCGRRYFPNQGEYIRRHHMKHHGLSYKEAWFGWDGGQWAVDENEKLMAWIRGDGPKPEGWEDDDAC